MRKAAVACTIVMCVLLGSGCFGPFDPTNPAPARTSDPDDTSGTGEPARTPGLLARWTCNESSTTELTDSLGTYNGIISGCSRAVGIDSNALRFGGGDNHVQIYPSQGDSSLNFKSGDFTISMWVKPMIVEGGDEDTMNIVARGTIKDRDGFVLTIIQNRFTIYFGNQKKETLNDDGPVTYGKFQHVVLTRREEQVRVFVDTKEVIAFTSTEPIQYDVRIPLIIGNDNTINSNLAFNGLIDEIKLLDISWDVSDVNREYQRFPQ